MTDAPLILLSGMGADERVFTGVKQELPRLAVPRWIDPLPEETLHDYARRFARRIDPGVPFYLGGASFGGFVALEMLGLLSPRACFLIGSVRSPAELPRALRLLRRMPVEALPFDAARLLGGLMLASSGRLSSGHVRGLLAQLADSEADFLRWACRAVLNWEASPVPTVPVFQIHGARDPVLPVKNTRPDRIVAGAGHALSMSHPKQVAAFLKEHITRSADNR